MSVSGETLPVYVVAPPSRPFASHWSLFVPDANSPATSGPDHKQTWLGRRIHVTGDRLNGFAYEMIRSYDVKKHRGVDAERQFPIGSIDRKHLIVQGDLSTVEPRGHAGGVVKDADEGGGFVDNEARDDLERCCAHVTAPGPSLNDSLQPLHNGKRLKVEVKDCQWWVRQVVQELVQRGILHRSSTAEGDPMELVALLPIH